MSTSHESPRDDPEASAPPSSRPPSRWAVLVPTLALLVGLVLGGVVVGVAQDGDGGAADDASTSEDAGSPSESPSVDEPGTAVVIPDSCLDAAESVEEATRLIRDGISAIREFRADEILDLLDNLEDIDNLARDQVSTCTGTTITDAPLDDAPLDDETTPEPAPSSDPAPSQDPTSTPDPSPAE